MKKDNNFFTGIKYLNKNKRGKNPEYYEKNILNHR